jgi:replicative DNA helicase
VTTGYEAPLNATDLAERALIGALLTDPGRVRDVRDWLRPSDVNHPQARVIYQTLTDLHRQGRTVGIRELPVVIAARDGDHPPITALDLHRYVQATPAASQQLGVQNMSSNHVFYARRVLEAAARHIVAVAGSRIQEAVEHAQTSPHLGPGAIAAALAQTQERLQVLGQRLRHSRGASGALITAALGGTPAPARSLGPQEGDPAGIALDLPTTPLTTRVVIEAEREVLTGCLTNPVLREQLLGWLTPGDFSRPEHAATWAAVGALTKAGTPLDYVTLAWECQRHHPSYDSPGLRADQLTTMAHHPPTTPDAAVRTVAHASLLRHTHLAQQHIQTLAQSQTDALALVSGATQAYHDVQDHARRLAGTTPAPSRIIAALNPTTTPRHPHHPWSTPPPQQPPPTDHHRGR